MGGAANAAVTAVCYAETKEKWRERGERGERRKRDVGQLTRAVTSQGRK